MSRVDQADSISAACQTLCYAIRNQPANLRLHAHFSRWLQQCDVAQLSVDLLNVPELSAALEVMYCHRHVVDQSLARLTGEVLKRQYGVHDGSSCTVQSDLLQRLSSDRLVLQWLELTFNTDLVWESLFKQIRRCLLFDTALAKALLPLTVALARQCFN
ncbi:hypothetical protein C2W62_46550, partial [Candidatus Entotheonella serta]